MPFDLLEFVGGHLLRVQHEKVVLEDVPLDKRSEIGPPPTGDAVGGLGDHALVGLQIVVEAPEIRRKVAVPYFASGFVLEHHQVLVELLSVVVLPGCGFHTVVKHFH